MTDYTELIKALRHCKIHLPCKECPRYGSTGNLCISDLHDDAAAAIEALLKENKELIEDHPEMVEADGHWEWRKPNGEVLMPKRGKWVVKGANRIDCSVCGHSVCFAFGLRDGSFDLYKYCPECGAKMEVQE